MKAQQNRQAGLVHLIVPSSEILCNSGISELTPFSSGEGSGVSPVRTSVSPVSISCRAGGVLVLDESSPGTSETGRRY